MDEILESIARSSGAEIREEMLPQLLSETHNKKVSRSSGLMNEFVNTPGLDSMYVSASDGKDGVCISKLCRRQYPRIRHIMFNTRLEYQATINLAKKQGAKTIPSTTSWIEFCGKEGYPVGNKQVSKRIHDVRSGAISYAITLFSKNYGLSNKWLHFLSCGLVDFPIS